MGVDDKVGHARGAKAASRESRNEPALDYPATVRDAEAIKVSSSLKASVMDLTSIKGARVYCGAQWP